MLPRVRTLTSGETVVGRPRDFDAPASNFLEAGDIKSVLAVPIFVEGEWSGIIGFENCRREHDWLPAEIHTIKILAELVSAAIISLRRPQVPTDANRIVEASPTIVYRMGPKAPFPLVNISQNIRRYGYDAAELLAAPDRWPQLMDAKDLPVALFVSRGALEKRSAFRRRRDDQFRRRDDRPSGHRARPGARR